MHKELVKKKSKLTILLSQTQNDDGASPDVAEPTLSHICWNPHTASFLSRLGQTNPHQAFQTIIGQFRLSLAFQTCLG